MLREVFLPPWAPSPRMPVYTFFLKCGWKQLISTSPLQACIHPMYLAITLVMGIEVVSFVHLHQRPAHCGLLAKSRLLAVFIAMRLYGPQA